MGFERPVVWATIDRDTGTAVITGQGFEALVREVNPNAKRPGKGGWVLQISELADLATLADIHDVIYRERDKKPEAPPKPAKPKKGKRMDVDDAEEWTQALNLANEGQWRQIALAHRLGVPEALGLTTREWVQLRVGYPRLPILERREAVRELASEGHTQRETAEILGVSPDTVNRDLNPERPKSDKQQAQATPDLSDIGQTAPETVVVIQPDPEQARTIERLRGELEDAHEEIRRLEDQPVPLFAEPTAPTTCPTCGQKVDPPLS